jgi:hypothetical protein
MAPTAQFRSIDCILVTLTIETMEANDSQTLLVEAAILITATRLRIARSMTLLAKLALEGVRSPCAEASNGGRRMPSSSLPPSASAL